MVGHTRSRAFADVDTDVEPLRLRDPPQQLLSEDHEREKLGNFILSEIAQLAHFSIWDRHQVPEGVGITIHYQKRIFSAHEDEMACIIAGARGFREEIGRARFLEVLKAPRRPQSFEFGFGKLHQLTRVRGYEAKSSLSARERQEPIT